MSQDRITWGVVGSGGIARRRTIPEGIAPSDQAELRVVYDTDSAANAAVAQQFHATAARSLEEMWRSEVDAVYIASPPNCHLPHVLAAAEAGKHVLCEKPLGMTVDEAAQMISACQRAGVRLGVGLMMRFHCYHLEALRIVQAGRLGRLVLGRAQLSCWYPPIPGAWRQDPANGGGGALMDMGAHTIDLLEMFFGPVKQVSCRIDNLVQAYASEDSAVALLTFESGAMGMVDTLFCVPDAASKNRLEIYGSGGSLLAEGTIGQGAGGVMTAHFEDSGRQYDSRQSRDETGGEAILLAPVNTYRAEIEEFCQAIRQRRNPSNSGELGLHNNRVLAACYQSARSGRIVDVESPT